MKNGSHVSLREKVDPHGLLPELTVTTKGHTTEGGFTGYTVHGEGREIGNLVLGRYVQGHLPMLRVAGLEFPELSAHDRRGYYFASWLWTYQRSLEEGRSLAADPDGSDPEELAACIWLSEAGLLTPLSRVTAEGPVWSTFKFGFQAESEVRRAVLERIITSID